MAESIDTIAAIATPSGRGGIGVIRVSGPLVTSIAKTILGKLPKPRYATYAKFLDKNNAVIDFGIAIYFTQPSSFTGEDILELHAHGGAFALDAILKRTLELGARLAKPGEFSERAFLNGKIDLVQAEAIADLINAASTQAARSAVRSLKGDFSAEIIKLRKKIIQLRLQFEASIDFPEEDIELQNKNLLTTIFSDIQTAFTKLKKQTEQGILLRDGATIVIAGKPNAGKSSLLNALTGEETAIVTDIPGTTRDVLRAEIQIDGLPLHIIDTAGLQETINPVEQEGIRRARKEILEADHVLCIVDAFNEPCRKPTEIIANLNLPHEINNFTIIFNKIDLTGDLPQIAIIDNIECLYVSAKDRLGLELLKNHIKTQIGFKNVESEFTFSARRRHLDLLEKASEQINLAALHFQENHATPLIAEDLRQAQNHLNEITGEFSSDDLLGLIFAEFCIGK